MELKNAFLFLKLILVDFFIWLVQFDPELTLLGRDEPRRRAEQSGPG